MVRGKDEATWHLLASVGLTAKRMREEGIGMWLWDQRIEYKRELLAGDLITIQRQSPQEVYPFAFRPAFPGPVAAHEFPAMSWTIPASQNAGRSKSSGKLKKSLLP